MENGNITVRRYGPRDEEALLLLIEREGDGWKEYWQGSGRAKYQRALASSITYLLFEGNVLCGYARCRDDDGFGVYVLDLLVDEGYRGKAYGRTLMERVCRDFPNDAVYVTGDVDPYYAKLGYAKEGTIYIVKPRA
ncbi:MAG: GNAT family N-acetyltransferase [Clostridia bacterium]|nr:GNAT family N-acetyltransferase [Clostridia bacterium]